jgi:hypothetical protein
LTLAKLDPPHVLGAERAAMPSGCHDHGAERGNAERAS